MDRKSIFSHYRKIVLVLLFLCIIMTVFLIFKTKSFSKPLIVNIDPNDIVIDSTLPISDTLGKSIEKNKLQNNIQGYVEISIKNPNDKKVPFKISITRKDLEDKQIDDSHVKLYLTDYNNVPLKGFEKNLIPSFYDLKVLVDKPDSKLLYKGQIDKNSEEKYILRIWVSDTYMFSNKLEKISFKVNVDI